LLYGLDACPVNVADKRSLDFVQTRLLMEMFNTGSVDIVHECCVMLNIRTVSSLIVSCKRKFLTKFVNNHNSICGAVSGLARRELNDLNWLYLYIQFVCLLLFYFFLSAVTEWRIKLNICIPNIAVTTVNTLPCRTVNTTIIIVIIIVIASTSDTIILTFLLLSAL